MCAARFDIRYTFTIAQAIDTSLHRYRCLVQSEFFVSTGSAHALVHTLASRWTPSRLTLVRSPLSVLLARPAGITGDGGRTRRRTRRDFFRFSFSCFSSSFFYSFICFILLPSVCARLYYTRKKEKFNGGGQTRRWRDLFLPRNSALRTFGIGNRTWAVHAHSPRVSSRFVFLGDKNSNGVFVENLCSYFIDSNGVKFIYEAVF